MKALLFRTVLVIHVELMLCSYFNKDFVQDCRYNDSNDVH